MHLNLDVGSRQILHLTGLDLTFLNGLDDGVLQRLRGLGEGNLTDDERLLVHLLDFRPHLDGAASLAVVVFRYIDAARGGEVWV